MARRVLPKARFRPRLPSSTTTLARSRLDQIFNRMDDRRLALVTGPAGSGKTTVVAQFATSAEAPVAWYRADPSDGCPEAFLSAVEQSLAVALDGFPMGATSIDDLIVTLDDRSDARPVLIIDDLHCLQGSSAEQMLAKLVDDAPPGVRMVFASRSRPGFNLSRLRVSGELLEVGPEDLRFRVWEVERLFRDLYEEPLPPEDLAELARRTEGWAAGLQLFHLATRGKPASARRRTLTELACRSRLVREYLADNVLNDLPERTREFLIGSCVLGRLSGALCDALLGMHGSDGLLEDLERRQVFTFAVEPGVYRYHEVLRSHLEFVLVERVGEEEARKRYRRAGELLEWGGAPADALRAYCRGEDWGSIAELLGRDGQQLAAKHGAWLDALPNSLTVEDPWLLLARARRHLALGHLEASASLYEQAQAAFAGAPAGDGCRRERAALGLWLDPSPLVRPDWMGLLRAATQRQPLNVAEQAANLPGARGRFVEGVAQLMAGRVKQAHELLRAAAALPELPPSLAVVARLLVVMTSFGERRNRDNVPFVSDEVEALEIPWLGQIWQRFGALVGADAGPSAGPPGRTPDASGESWSDALTAMAEGVDGLLARRPRADRFDSAAKAFDRLGSGVAEVWARCGQALTLALDGDQAAEAVALGAVHRARDIGLPGAEALALVALAQADPERSAHCLTLAGSLAAECGFPLPPGAVAGRGEAPAHQVARPPASDLGTAAVPVTIACLGGFRIEVAGVALDLDGLRPRCRSALRLLALEAGRAVHREMLLGALWPDVDDRIGTRNLHVTISTLRRFLMSGSAAHCGASIVREGDTYRLALPAGAVVDARTLTTALEEGRAARRVGDTAGAVAAFAQALDAYGGDLLPEEGPAEWVTTKRESYRMEGAEAAQCLSELQCGGGNAVAAVSAAERGLRIDRYRDGLWRALVAAYELAGDHAAAARTRRSYDSVLVELGVTASAS